MMVAFGLEKREILSLFVIEGGFMGLVGSLAGLWPVTSSIVI